MSGGSATYVLHREKTCLQGVSASKLKPACSATLINFFKNEKGADYLFCFHAQIQKVLSEGVQN